MTLKEWVVRKQDPHGDRSFGFGFALAELEGAGIANAERAVVCRHDLEFTDDDPIPGQVVVWVPTEERGHE